MKRTFLRVAKGVNITLDDKYIMLCMITLNSDGLAYWHALGNGDIVQKIINNEYIRPNILIDTYSSCPCKDYNEKNVKNEIKNNSNRRIIRTNAETLYAINFVDTELYKLLN